MDYVIENRTLVRYTGTDPAVRIPEGITEIGNRGFLFKKVTCLILPKYLQELGEYALAVSTRQAVVFFTGHCPFQPKRILGFPETQKVFDSICNMIAFYPGDDPTWKKRKLLDYNARSVEWIPWDPQAVISAEQEIETRRDLGEAMYAGMWEQAFHAAAADTENTKQFRELFQACQFLQKGTDLYYLFDGEEPLELRIYGLRVILPDREDWNHDVELGAIEIPVDYYSEKTYIDTKNLRIEDLGPDKNGNCRIFCLNLDDFRESIVPEGTLTIGVIGYVFPQDIYADTEIVYGISDTFAVNSRSYTYPEDGFMVRDGKLFRYSGDGSSDIVIPDGITSIGVKAFAHDPSVRSVTVPASVQCIESMAFCDCRNLSKIIFAEGLEIIQSSAFYGCRSLREVTFPSTLEGIGLGAFRWSGLETVTFRSVPSLDDLFDSSQHITAYYPESLPEWTEEMCGNYGAGSIEWIPVNTGQE